MPILTFLGWFQPVDSVELNHVEVREQRVQMKVRELGGLAGEVGKDAVWAQQAPGNRKEIEVEGLCLILT